MGGLPPEVEWDAVATAAAALVEVVEAVAVEVVGREALHTHPRGVRPTPASLRSSLSWI